jgi:histone deacetylase HOS3
MLIYISQDGKPELVQAASVSIHGAHGQYIENMHLSPYTSEAHFWKELYQERYSKLLDRAATFLQETQKEGCKDDVLIFIRYENTTTLYKNQYFTQVFTTWLFSCGFDACEHEYESMSRHGRKVPVGFYHRFAQDTRMFADNWANGRIISVLEGGYSDKALTSGAMAHVSGLVGLPYQPEWWSEDNLIMVRGTVLYPVWGKHNKLKLCS